jgi:hypothetical protein
VWVGVGVLALGAVVTLIFGFDTRAESAAVNRVASHGESELQMPAPARASAPTAA